MPTSTYIPLANLTLAGSDSEVTFASIPNTYRDLLVVVNANGTQQTELFLRLNGDTSAIYNTVRMQGSGTTASGGSTANQTGARLNGNGDIMTNFSFNAIIQLIDYSTTNKHKSGLSRTNSSSGVDACTFRWASTSAVDSVTVYPAAGSFAIDSTFALYGIVS